MQRASPALRGSAQALVDPEAQKVADLVLVDLMVDLVPAAPVVLMAVLAPVAPRVVVPAPEAPVDLMDLTVVPDPEVPKALVAQKVVAQAPGALVVPRVAVPVLVAQEAPRVVVPDQKTAVSVPVPAKDVAQRGVAAMANMAVTKRKNLRLSQSPKTRRSIRQKLSKKPLRRKLPSRRDARFITTTKNGVACGSIFLCECELVMQDLKSPLLNRSFSKSPSP